MYSINTPPNFAYFNQSPVPSLYSFCDLIIVLYECTLISLLLYSLSCLIKASMIIYSMLSEPPYLHPGILEHYHQGPATPQYFPGSFLYILTILILLKSNIKYSRGQNSTCFTNSSTFHSRTEDYPPHYHQSYYFHTFESRSLTYNNQHRS